MCLERTSEEMKFTKSFVLFCHVLFWFVCARLSVHVSVFLFMRSFLFLWFRLSFVCQCAFFYMTLLLIQIIQEIKRETRCRRLSYQKQRHVLFFIRKRLKVLDLPSKSCIYRLKLTMPSNWMVMFAFIQWLLWFPDALKTTAFPLYTLRVPIVSPYMW